MHHSLPRKTQFLEQIRMRLRHAWVLHFSLVLSLLLLPVGRLARADEDVFEYTRTESSVSVTVSAPEGTTGMTRGSSRPMTVNVQQNTWDVWTGVPHGITRIQNYQTMPMASTGLTFSATEDGLVSNASLSTDGSANASATFTMGTKASNVTVMESSAGATGSLTFATPEDTWIFDHCESLLSASLSADGTTDGLPGGTGRQLQAHVDYSWWYVYVSDLDPARTKVDSYNIGPAQNAAVTWSVPNGDGTLTSQAGFTDNTGNATASFTMGGTASSVRADVAYGTGSSTYATLGFSPHVTVWTHHHDETTLTTTLSTSDAVTRLDPGTAKWVTAQTLYNTLEVWYDDLGNRESRNPTSSAASGAQLSFYTDQGDGTVSDGLGTVNPTVAADADGLATVLFVMGSQDSRVVANGSYSLASSIGSLDFTLRHWSFDHSASSLGMDLSLNPATVTASVYVTAWDVYTDGTVYDNRNYTISPTGGAQVTFGADSYTTLPIDPSTNTDTVSTGMDGMATTAYTCTPELVGNITANAIYNDATTIRYATASIFAGIPDAILQQYWIPDIHALRLINGDGDGLTWLQAYRTGYLTSLMPCGCVHGGTPDCSCAHAGAGCNGSGSCFTPPSCGCGGNNCSCTSNLECGGSNPSQCYKCNCGGNDCSATKCTSATNCGGSDPASCYKCKCGGEDCSTTKCTLAANCNNKPDNCTPCVCSGKGDKCSCAHKGECQGNEDQCKSCDCPFAGTTCTCNAKGDCAGREAKCDECQCPAKGDGCSCSNANGCDGVSGNCSQQQQTDSVSFSIAPNMAGVVGDFVPSSKGTAGETHFVSPKAGPISAPNVILQANFYSREGRPFDDLYWWDDNGNSSGGTTLNISRANYGWHVVQLMSIDTGKAVADMNVWIVWATCSGPVPAPSSTKTSAPTPEFYRIARFPYYGNQNNDGRFVFKFKIYPTELFSETEDAPKLRDEPTVGSLPDGKHCLKGNSLKDGVNTTIASRWDVTRSLQVTIYNPSSIPVGDLADYNKNIPIYSKRDSNNHYNGILEPWPSDDIVGNDDSITSDEDSNPWDVGKNDVAHAKGEICQSDQPRLGGPWPDPEYVGTGTTWGEKDEFREFVRVQLGTNWYRASDWVEWKYELQAVIQNMEWVNTSSNHSP